MRLGAFRVRLISLRTHKAIGYRYYFAAQSIRCVGGANALLFTVGHSKHRAPCARGTILVSRPVKPHRAYRVHVRAVRTGHKRILKRGASYSGRLWMPGNEAHWKPVSRIPPAF